MTGSCSPTASRSAGPLFDIGLSWLCPGSRVPEWRRREPHRRLSAMVGRRKCSLSIARSLQTARAFGPENLLVGAHCVFWPSLASARASTAALAVIASIISASVAPRSISPYAPCEQPSLADSLAAGTGSSKSPSNSDQAFLEPTLLHEGPRARPRPSR